MGLATEESWGLTPREFDALCRRLEARLDWQSALAAQTPWMIALALGGKEDAPALEELMLTRAAVAAKRRQETALAKAFGVG